MHACMCVCVHVLCAHARARVCVCARARLLACFITWKYFRPQYVIMHNFIIFKVNYINLMSNLMFLTMFD